MTRRPPILRRILETALLRQMMRILKGSIAAAMKPIERICRI